MKLKDKIKKRFKFYKNRMLKAEEVEEKPKKEKKVYRTK